jgi:hypothetical protein
MKEVVQLKVTRVMFKRSTSPMFSQTRRIAKERKLVKVTLFGFWV